MIEHIAEKFFGTLLDGYRDGLKRTIRNYDALRANPRAFLAQTELRIGPNPWRSQGLDRAKILYFVAILPPTVLLAIFESAGGSAGPLGLVPYVAFVIY